MKFLIIGGDQRTLELKQMLKNDGHEIKTYGLGNNQNNSYKYLELEKTDSIKTLDYILKSNFDAIIGPIPFTKDGENINAPFIENKIAIKNLMPYLKNQTLVAGPFSDDLKQQLEKNNINAKDIMQVEELVIYNTIATAEGAIEIAIANTEKNLHESKILILGFGRVAKTLAIKLKGLSKEITCMARKYKDFAWIDTLGFNVDNINNLEKNIRKYDLIINTVPHIILTEDKLKNVRNDTLIIDLASKPGGVDVKAVNKFNLKYIWALALPGKVAPISSARYIKDAIYNIIK